MMEHQIHRHRIERGEILRLLAEAKGGRMLFRSLWRALDRRAYSISEDTLRFHLETVLADLGLVKLMRVSDQPVEIARMSWQQADDILAVMLTAAGVNALNSPGKYEEIEL